MSMLHFNDTLFILYGEFYSIQGYIFVKVKVDNAVKDIIIIAKDNKRKKQQWWK